MFKYILERAGDIEWMAIVPLVLFVVFFIVIVWKAMSHKKEFVDRMANMPLQDDNTLEVEQ
ncbi:MAG: cbb3-type cytochrome c oxidase subunit 3 [Bacteroidetes bacterium]|nr:MAG: cbb3-type cytochrome c oxidase subunit 3 [Bacteroidota bacterium]